MNECQCNQNEINKLNNSKIKTTTNWKDLG